MFTNFCKACLTEKPATDFYIYKFKDTQYIRNSCKVCYNAGVTIWRQKNRLRSNAVRRTYRLNNRSAELITKARFRAKKYNLEFNIEKKDIIIPSHCPALNIPLYIGTVDSYACIDRINNKGGYTKDNVHVISYRANRLKSDATLEELKSLVQYLEDKQ